MKDLNKFQFVVMGIFIFAALAAVVIFATTKARPSGQVTLGPVSVWGELNERTFSDFINRVNDQIQDKTQFVNIRYFQKDPATIHDELLEAVADGSAPDIIILPHDYIGKYSRRIFLIPYETISERAFSDLFTEGSEIFKLQGGIAGVPFAVDPLVMYWNRDIFTNANISQPPATWDDLSDLVKVLTIKDRDFRIEQSLIGLGEYRNIDHAKAILSVLALQRGSLITQLQAGNAIVASFGSGLEDALSFYTAYADPSSNYYSWNRSLQSSKEQFLLGKSALYIGFGSEALELRQKNPNLNFDVAALPQVKNAPRRLTYGTIYGFSVLRTSPHIADALGTIWKLASSNAAQAWTQISNLPPVQRSLLGQQLPDRFGTLLNQSALIAKAWLDPDPVETDGVFNNLIESVTSGKLSVDQALMTATNEINAIR